MSTDGHGGRLTSRKRAGIELCRMNYCSSSSSPSPVWRNLRCSYWRHWRQRQMVKGERRGGKRNVSRAIGAEDFEATNREEVDDLLGSGGIRSDNALGHCRSVALTRWGHRSRAMALGT